MIHRPAIASVLSVVLAACGAHAEVDTGGVDVEQADTAAGPACSEDEVAAVALSVQDATGAALSRTPGGLFVRVWVDEAPVAACEAGATPDRFSCGVQQPGRMRVQVGLGTVVHDELIVDVGADECRVLGVSRTLRLRAASDALVLR